MPEKTETKPRCPNCKSCEVIPLQGLLPGFTAYDSTDPTLMTAAQCVETDEALTPDWRCEDCGHAWADAGEGATEG